MAEVVSGAALDLSDAVQSDSCIIDMLRPGTDKPTGWRIELAGPGHPKTIAAGESISRERLDKDRAMELAQVNGRKWKPEQETPADRAKRNVTFVVRRIVGWTPAPVFKFFSDEPVAFSEDAAVKLFLHPKMGAYLGQITEYLASEKAFTEASAQS